MRWPWRRWFWTDHCYECPATSYHLGPVTLYLAWSSYELGCWWREFLVRLGLRQRPRVDGDGAARFIPEIWSAQTMDVALPSTEYLKAAQALDAAARNPFQMGDTIRIIGPTATLDPATTPPETTNG